MIIKAATARPANPSSSTPEKWETAEAISTEHVEITSFLLSAEVARRVLLLILFPYFN